MYHHVDVLFNETFHASDGTSLLFLISHQHSHRLPQVLHTPVICPQRSQLAHFLGGLPHFMQKKGTITLLFVVLDSGIIIVWQGLRMLSLTVSLCIFWRIEHFAARITIMRYYRHYFFRHGLLYSLIAYPLLLMTNAQIKHLGYSSFQFRTRGMSP
jgi:hypothetical protein